jgi:AAA+ ATPase superfamily predicted ATPase
MVMILREIILGGLLLPFRIYFLPNRFFYEIADLAPELPRRYSLWQARHKLREQAFRRAILILFSQIFMALFGAFTLAYFYSTLGFNLKWIDIDVESGFPIKNADSFFSHRLTGYQLAFIIVVAIIMLVISILVIKPGTWEFIWSGVVIGNLIGFILGGALGGAPRVQIVGLGICFGILTGFMCCAISEDARGVRVPIFLFTFFSTIFGIVEGIKRGITGGVVLGLSGGIASGIISALTSSHLLVYPIQWCLSYISWLVCKVVPVSLLRFLWRISPVRWDEIIILPLPGLSRFLLNLHRYDSVLGEEAIDEVRLHDYQDKAAYQALCELALQEAQQIDTLPAIASFERGLDWLDSTTRLPNKSRAPLLLLKEISQIIDAAQRSDTLRNKVSQLRLAEEKAKSLSHIPGEFSLLLANWRKLVSEGLLKAEEERRVLEPIRQVYFNDGVPISPDELPEEELPFKGRLDTVRELEGALSNSRSATLLLTGNRRSGKSSLLLQLPRKLGPQVLPAFLDCQSAKFVGSESASGLLLGLAEEIREQARRNAEKFRRDPLNCPRLDHEAFERDPYPAFAHWLEGVERALGGRQLLLCLDEFEKLEESIAEGRIDGRFLSLLRNIIQHHSRIIVLLSGSHHLDELPPRWADALVTTQSLRISFLDEADARELIIHPVKEFPEIYQSAAVERILTLTHSQPYLVQLVCGLLVEKMNKERREPPGSYVTLVDIEAIIPKVLERSEAYFNDLWRSQTGGNLAQRVLEKLAFADGEQVISAEVKLLTEDQEALRNTIRTLLRREIIEPTENGYRITVPLIAYYVRSQLRPV